MLSPDLGLRSLAVLCLAVAATAGRLHAQAPAVITGSVTEEAGAPVADAVVTLSAGDGAVTDRTALSDAEGRFGFEGVRPGSYEIRARRIGFVEFRRTLSVPPGGSIELPITLATDTIRVAEVVARTRASARRERERFDSEPGVTTRVVDVASVRLLPGLAEPDVLRAVALLPGVVSTSDFSSAFHVRGGSSDQNLITIDGFTVFNPFHLGGMFSVFNPDAVERAELFSGGFGAEFGGRVSSVLNVESRSAVSDSLAAHGGVSLLSTRLLLQAPFPDRVVRAAGGDRGGWFLSARRSYFDQVLRPVADFPYHLTDIQGHASVFTSSGARVALTAYWGEDVLDLSDRDVSGPDADVLRLRWGWGNRVVGASWFQPLSRGWNVDSRVGISRFADHLAFVDFGDVDFASRIDQITVRTDLRRDGGVLEPRLGLAIEAVDHRNLAVGGGTTFFDSDGSGALVSAYVGARLRPSGRWIVEPGARIEWWRSGAGTRSVTSPRFAVKWFFGTGEDLALKLAVGRYAQFVQSIRDEELPVSNETWILADASVPHIVSDQVQFGFEGFLGDAWSASVEGYWRDFDGVVDFNLVEDPNDPADDFVAGTGVAKGLDLMLRRSTGRLTGWAALSLLRAERTFPDPVAAAGEDPAATVTYPPIFDRRVNFDLVLEYRAILDFDFGLRWNYGSGLPYTRPVAQHLSWSHDPITGRMRPSDGGPDDEDGPPTTVVLGPRNAERYPAYHRLDLTLRRTFERRWGRYTPYLQVLNVYDRRNVLFYFYDYDRDPPVRSGFSMFPFLPAIGVEVSF